nr:hypothetical protein [Rubripirellula sp.]
MLSAFGHGLIGHGLIGHGLIGHGLIGHGTRATLTSNTEIQLHLGVVQIA